MVSYEVERRIMSRFDHTIRNTPEERRKRRPLLRFAYSSKRKGLTGMPVLAILYPSPSLAEIGDPVPVPESGRALADVVARARERLEPLLARLTEPYRDARREDESWYWVAPILLDLQKHEASTRAWFRRSNLASQWTGEKKER